MFLSEWLKNGLLFKRVYRFFLPSDQKDIHPKEYGSKSELTAIKYLKNHGFKILKTNYKSKLGEIDIIAEKDKTLVFVEVKARRTLKYGSPSEAIDEKKMRKISIVSLEYLKRNNLIGRKSRFDVIALYNDGKNKEINHIENAFELRYK